MQSRDELGIGPGSGGAGRWLRRSVATSRIATSLGSIAILLGLALGCAHHGHGQECASRSGQVLGDGHSAAGAAGAFADLQSGDQAARHAALDRLVAIEEIQQLKARFMRCVDTRDLACLRDEVFAPGAEVYFKGGDYEIRANGWTAIGKFYEDAFSTKKFGMHTAHTPEISVDGENARGIWYLHDIFVNLEEGWTLQGSALYHDRYAKIDDQWRIVYTTYERLFEETTPRDPRTKLGSRSVKE